MGTNEVLEIFASNLTTKCIGNSSCSLIIGVIGNAPLNSSWSSNYTLTQMDQRLRIVNSSIQTRSIPIAGAYDYFWFTITTKQGTVNRTKWNSVVTVTTPSLQSDVDIYASLFASGSSLPTDASSDYQGDNYGPDLINITSRDAAVIN